MIQKLKAKAMEEKKISEMFKEDGNQIEATYHLIRSNAFLEATTMLIEEMINDTHKQNNLSVHDGTEDIH